MNKVFKFATLYSLYTTADLKTNMAIRILHSLIPTLVADTATLSEQEDLSGFLARDLIPGAKEVYKYGAAAIAREFDFCFNDHKRDTVQKAINTGDFENGIDMAIEWFNTDFGSSGGVGGKKWVVFAQTLKKIGEQIGKVEKTGSKTEAMKLSSYLNVLDSLSHNSGSFMEKFVEEESFDKKDIENQLKNLKDLLRMRDITTLQDPEQIISLIQTNPDIVGRLPRDYQKMIKEYRRIHPAKEESAEQGRELLRQEAERKAQEAERQKEEAWKDTSKMYSANFGGNYS
jgi:hypothetical protein